jgi:hypothetical protein
LAALLGLYAKSTPSKLFIASHASREQANDSSQVVLCNGDDTIERSTYKVAPGSGYGVEGAMETRSCRSIDRMCDVLKEKGVGNKSCVPALDPRLYRWSTTRVGDEQTSGASLT